MTPRKTDLKERKEKILTITVDQYIRTVSPVSSAFIAKEYGLDLSPATIRHVLAELEEEGYLTHPHTSSGRVPTQNGYRYYVDYLMDEIHLLEEEKNRIRAETEREYAELDVLLEKTSRVLSQMTHYTTFVSVDGLDNKVFCQGTSFIVGYPEYQDTDKIRAILAALDEKERLLEIINKELVQRIEIFIGDEMECADIDTCSLVVSRYRSRQGVSGRIAVLGPTRMDYKKVVSVVDYFSGLMEDIL